MDYCDFDVISVQTGGSVIDSLESVTALMGSWGRPVKEHLVLTIAMSRENV